MFVARWQGVTLQQNGGDGRAIASQAFGSRGGRPRQGGQV